MPTVTELLDHAAVKYEPYAKSSIEGIYLTAANQLVGTYEDLRAFVKTDPDYHGWQAHHVVESQDLERLRIHTRSPPRERQLCVLLPERAHIDRINSILRSRVPVRTMVTAKELLLAYDEAYSVMGDYCGGGERLIRRELTNIVHSTFKSFNLV